MQCTALILYNNLTLAAVGHFCVKQFPIRLFSLLGAERLVFKTNSGICMVFNLTSKEKNLFDSLFLGGFGSPSLIGQLIIYLFFST